MTKPAVELASGAEMPNCMQNIRHFGITVLLTVCPRFWTIPSARSIGPAAGADDGENITSVRASNLASQFKPSWAQ